MNVNLHLDLRIKPIFQLFLQCTWWCIFMFSDHPRWSAGALVQVLRVTQVEVRCPICCPSWPSRITLSLCLRRCPGAPTSSCFSGLVPHQRCGTAGLRPAASMQRMGRFFSGGGFTHQVQGSLCSQPSLLSWILLEKRESSSDGECTAPFVKCCLS